MEHSIQVAASKESIPIPFPEPPVGGPKVKPFTVIVQMVLGGVLGYLSIRLLFQFIPRPEGKMQISSLLAMVIGLGIGFIPTIILHELGHAVMGWISGMRMLLVNLGPISIVKRNNQFEFERLRGARAFAGLALFMPQANTSKLQLAMFILGGPVANFVQAAILIALSFLSTTWISAFCLGLSFSAILLGAINLMPFTTRGQLTDGAQLRDMLKGGKQFDARMSLMHFVIQAMGGTPLEELDMKLVEQAIAESNTPSRNMIRVYPHALALKQGNWQAARQQLVLAAADFAQYPEGMRQPVAIQAAVYLTAFEPDFELARRWLALSKGGMMSPSERAQAEALDAFLQGDPVRANQRLQDAKQNLGKCFDKAWAGFLAWQLELLEKTMARHDWRATAPA